MQTAYLTEAPNSPLLAWGATRCSRVASADRALTALVTHRGFLAARRDTAPRVDRRPPRSPRLAEGPPP